MLVRCLFICFLGFGVHGLQNPYCQLSCDFNMESVPHTVCDREEQKCGPDSSCGPDFKVIYLDDDDRQYILDIHNYMRNKVSLGYEKRNNQPQAANMRILRYNKELEFIAQCWANACNGNPLKHDRCRRTVSFEYVGQNLGYVYSSDPKLNKIRSMRDLILLWYDEVAVFNGTWVNETKIRDTKYVVGHYTQLVWAETTDIGCAMSYYTEHISGETWHQILFVCNYAPGGNFLGRPIYEAGKPTSQCPGGFARNSLYKGLCGTSEKAKEAANFTFDIFELK